MKKIMLKSLRIHNFGNIKDMLIEFGNQTYIKGKNESGKTTIGDAYSWLMTNHLMSGRQADGIRPIKNGVQEDFVDIVVEAVFNISGREVTIQKTQSPEWTKKDGKFKGNVNKYMINGIPKKEKEYKEYIEENVMEPERFELCTSAAALLKLDTTKRRQTLFGMVSEFSDEDVIATDEKFEPIRDMLPDGTVEELIARTRYQINGRGRADKGLQGKLDEFPARIDEASKKIVDVAEFELAINGLKNELVKLNDKEKELDNLSEAYDKKSKEIVELIKHQEQIKTDRNASIMENRKKIREQIDGLKARRKDKCSELSFAEMDLKHANMAIERHSANLQNLYKEWDKEYKKVFAYEDKSSVCIYSGKPCEFIETYNSDERQKSESDFLEERKKRLDEIESNGDSEKAELEKSKNFKANSEQKIAELKREISSIDSDIAIKEGELSKLPETADLSSDSEYLDVLEKIEAAKNQLDNMDNGAEQRREIKSERDRIISEISSYQTQIKTSHDAQDRVDELEAQRAVVRQKLADCQRELDLLRDFQKKKCEMLTEKINGLFVFTKWELIKYNQDGEGYEEICEPSFKDIKYNSRLNNGARSLIDIDICFSFQKRYGVGVPIWVDNAERMSGETIKDLSKIDSQLIFLRVSEGNMEVEII